MIMGHSDLGDLFSTDIGEIKKTADCLYNLVRQCEIGLSQKRKYNEMVIFSYIHLVAEI